jgi:hypothetical protein
MSKLGFVARCDEIKLICFESQVSRIRRPRNPSRISFDISCSLDIHIEWHVGEDDIVYFQALSNVFIDIERNRMIIGVNRSRPLTFLKWPAFWETQK